jgi:hypothetical protein
MPAPASKPIPEPGEHPPPATTPRASNDGWRLIGSLSADGAPSRHGFGFVAPMPFYGDGRTRRAGGRLVGHYLSEPEVAAADEVVRRVLAHVPAQLELALLFGSKARRAARADSDVDVLLVFRRLPWDREPQAGMAEEIASEVAAETGVPVATWTVSLMDLERGRRTPMLVDALNDGVPLWPRDAVCGGLRFTPDDAVSCAGALLQRVREGSAEAAEHLRAGDMQAAATRARDDLVRLCTAALLLRGETRPRRAGAVLRAAERPDLPVGDGDRAVLRWAARSYGTQGKDAALPVPPPPGGFRSVAREIDRLRAWVARQAQALERHLAWPAG